MPGIVVVQHMPPVFTAMFADRLNRELPFDVVEAKDNTPIKPGSIHIAPGDMHLRIKKVGSQFFTVVGGQNKVSGHCPSVDVLFESVAAVAGSSAMGVILTGMGADGAANMLKMRQRGAFTVGQDEASCVVYGMPRKAYELGAVARQAPLGDIAAILMNQLGI
jgi:two-component system chemotaxis response regulator CheB